MAKVWKAGDYIPVAYINQLEMEVEELRKLKPKESKKNGSKDKD